MRPPPVYWLSFHVPYACRHAGACCSSGWPIPLERTRVAAIRALRADGSWLLPAPDAPPDVAGVLAVSKTGHCVFHRDGCDIHHALGHGALPSACQHFPREILIDRRGVFVTLSHYCPTAADLLFEHAGPVEIVEGPWPIADGEPEGLDARDVFPPLLCEGVLMDDEGYSAWERHMVRVLTEDNGFTPEQVIVRLQRDLAAIQRWRPGQHSLAGAIARVSEARPPAGPSPGAAGSAVIRRFLAARAFASWMPYQGHGVAAAIGGLQLALRVLRQQLSALAGEAAAPSPAQLKEAIRQTDLLLLQQMPRDELVKLAVSEARGLARAFPDERS